MNVSDVVMGVIMLLVVLAIAGLLLFSPMTLVVLLRWSLIVASVPVVLFLLFGIWTSVVPWK